MILSCAYAAGNCGVRRVCKGLGCEIEGQGSEFQCGDAVRGDNTHEDKFEQEVLNLDVLVAGGLLGVVVRPVQAGGQEHGRSGPQVREQAQGGQGGDRL